MACQARGFVDQLGSFKNAAKVHGYVFDDYFQTRIDIDD